MKDMGRRRRSATPAVNLGISKRFQLEQPRVVRRVTVHGVTAVSVDGRRSTQLRRPEATNDAQIDALVAAAH